MTAKKDAPEKMSVVDEIKLAKLETFVDKIYSVVSATIGWDEALFYCGSDKINVYSKTILTNTTSRIKDFEDGRHSIEYMLNRAKKFAIEHPNSGNAINGLLFLLMSLAVDKTDYEKRLSMICDIAVMHGINDDDMADIVQLVRFLFRDLKAEDITFKTEWIENYFECLKPLISDIS